MMSLAQILINQYRQDIQSKIEFFRKQKELVRAKAIAQDLIKEKKYKEKEYHLERKKKQTEMLALQDERKFVVQVPLVLPIVHEKEVVIKMDEIIIQKFENELASLNSKILDSETKVLQLTAELKETKHWAKSSWDEWNYRKRVFKVDSMEALYGEKP